MSNNFLNLSQSQSESKHDGKMFEGGGKKKAKERLTGGEKKRKNKNRRKPK